MAKIDRVIQIKLNRLSLRKCPYEHPTYNQSVFVAITVTNTSHSFYLQDGGENQLA